MRYDPKKRAWGRPMVKRDLHGLGHPLYVNGHLYQEPVTISHVPGVGEIDPSMGDLGSYVAYAPQLPPMGADDPAAAPPAPAPTDFVSPLFRIWKYVAPVSALACAYHGYKRNNSIGWALVWFLLGGIPLTPVIAVAQGFGDRKGLSPNRGLTRRQRGARKGARTRAAGGTRLWTVIDEKTNRSVGTIVAPSWKTHDDVKQDAQTEHGSHVYVAYKRKANGRRRNARKTGRLSPREFIALAGRTAHENRFDVVNQFNQDFHSGKLGDLGYSSDAAWKIYKAAYDQSRKRGSR